MMSRMNSCAVAHPLGPVLFAISFMISVYCRNMYSCCHSRILVYGAPFGILCPVWVVWYSIPTTDTTTSTSTLLLVQTEDKDPLALPSLTFLHRYYHHRLLPRWYNTPTYTYLPYRIIYTWGVVSSTLKLSSSISSTSTSSRKRRKHHHLDIYTVDLEFTNLNRKISSTTTKESHKNNIIILNRTRTFKCHECR